MTYSTGTVTVATGSADVIGVGTLWGDNVVAGEKFVGPDGRTYNISIVAADGLLRLSVPYAGLGISGSAYLIADNIATASRPPSNQMFYQVTPQDFGFQFTMPGDEQQDCMQQAANALMAEGGGVLLLPRGIYTPRAVQSSNGEFGVDYVAYDHQRNAPMALRLFQAADITIQLAQGAMIDRSGDAIVADGLQTRGGTIYMAQSERCFVLGGYMRGLQNDAALLADLKTDTSGNGVMINDGCVGCGVKRMTFENGTTAITVGTNSAHDAAGDPSLADCVDTVIQDITSFNNEHTYLLVKSRGAELRNIQQRRKGQGVCQRGGFHHSDVNTIVDGFSFEDVWKTGLNISNYAAHQNIKLRNGRITMMPPDTVQAMRQQGYELPYEGIGIRLATTDTENLSIKNVDIEALSGVIAAETGLRDFVLKDVNIRAGRSGFATEASTFGVNDTSAVVVNNPSKDWVFDGLDILVQDEMDGYEGAEFQPDRGLLIRSGATDGQGVTPATLNQTGLQMVRSRIRSQERNARFIDVEGVSSGNVYEHIDVAGSRDFDANHTRGQMNFRPDDIFVTHGRAQGPDDEVGLADGAVMALTPPALSGWINITDFDSSDRRAKIYYNAFGATPPLPMVEFGGADVAVSTGDLSGASDGVASRLTVSVLDGKIYIKNRLGVAVTPRIWF